MSNLKTVVINVPATSIAIARLQADDGSNHLVPVLFAEGAEAVMIPVSVPEKRAESFLKSLALPVLGDLLLNQLMGDKGIGQLRPEAVAALDIAFGPVDAESELVADSAVSTNLDTGETAEYTRSA